MLGVWISREVRIWDKMKGSVRTQQACPARGRGAVNQGLARKTRRMPMSVSRRYCVGITSVRVAVGGRTGTECGAHGEEGYRRVKD